MKLIVQVPCLNEEKTLPSTIANIPKKIPGIDSVEILVIDDGSSDKTVEVARSLGVDHILSLGSNRGLAYAFKKGLEKALKLGADIVVNTDGDNQYYGPDIKKLVQPILAKEADLVVGCRPIANHPEFSFGKKLLQKLGSWALRKISQTNIQDAASGFRAFSRETCLRLSIISKFSYTMETIIQSGNSVLRVSSVDIRVNKKTRNSRLFKTIPEFVYKSASTILAMFMIYRPAYFFSIISSFFLFPAFCLGLRFIYMVYFAASVDPTRTYLPSLILLMVLALAGFISIAMGFLGEQIKATRFIQQEALYLAKKNAYLIKSKNGVEGSYDFKKNYALEIETKFKPQEAAK